MGYSPPSRDPILSYICGPLKKTLYLANAVLQPECTGTHASKQLTDIAKTVNSCRYHDAVFVLTLMLKLSMRLPANIFAERKEIS
jgi:hypothetical protein